MLYGRITGLVFSLFLPAFYRHVARSWGGIGILYLLLLFTLTWIPPLVKFHLKLRELAEVEFPKYAKDIPDVSIKNGKVSSPAPQPFEVKDERGNVVFVLDTTGKINNLDQTKAMILLTENKLYQRDQMNNIQIHDLSTFPDFELNSERLQDWADGGATWLPISVFPFCLFGSMIRGIIIMLLASIAGLIFNAAFNAKMTYGGLLRFGAVGMTLSAYISTVLWTMWISVPFWFFICLGLTIAYVGFGTFVSVPKLADMHLDDEEHDDDWRRRDHETGANLPRNDGYPADDGSFKAERP